MTISHKFPAQGFASLVDGFLLPLYPVLCLPCLYYIFYTNKHLLTEYGLPAPSQLLLFAVTSLFLLGTAVISTVPNVLLVMASGQSLWPYIPMLVVGLLTQGLSWLSMVVAGLLAADIEQGWRLVSYGPSQEYCQRSNLNPECYSTNQEPR